MASRPNAQAVLITGVFGSGKSSVAAEIADILEGGGLPYAAVDLDWLGWFDTGGGDGPDGDGIMLSNLAAVVGNYLSVGIRLFVLAGFVGHKSELDGLRAALPMPLRVFRLTVPLQQIEERLRSDVTSARPDDLREAAAQIAASYGVGIEDLTVRNDRPIREVAMEVLDGLGWMEGSSPETVRRPHHH